MKRTIALALAALSLALAAAACRQLLPTNRFLRMRPIPAHGTADARGKFDHNRHTKVLQQAAVTCLDCHRFDAQITSDDPTTARQLSNAALKPGSAACHSCHTQEETRLSTAPSACITCHEDLHELKPADHDLAWMKVHANVARVNSERCESCHRQSQCIDCHERRDSIQTRVHDRNFRFFHGIQARANPMQCSSCHRLDYCSRCHERGSAEGG